MCERTGRRIMKKMLWDMPIPERARRIAKLASFDEYILVHVDRHTAALTEIRIHYDPVERLFYRETAYQEKPSTWDVAPLPVLIPDPGEEE